MDTAALTALLTQSRARNEAAHITGMLIYVHAKGNGQSDGRFMQVIEGEKEVVQKLFSAICNDDRHHEVMVLSEEPIRQRSFKNWTMGFNAIDATEATNLPEYLDLSNHYTTDKHLSGISKPVNYLKSFYQINLELS